MKARWSKLLGEFYDEDEGEFDASKIPDIFDSVRYDILYNSKCIGLGTEQMDQLWETVDELAAFVIPQEYGVTQEDKVKISRLIAKPFFSLVSEKITDMLKDSEQPRLILSFCSESH